MTEYTQCIDEEKLEFYEKIGIDETEAEEIEFLGSDFIIDDASKANWAIKKIAEKRRSKNFFVNACKREIEQLKKKITAAEESCDNNCSFLISKLSQYMDREDVPSKETKTQISLKLPSGKIVRKKAKVEICDLRGNTGSKLKDNAELVEVARSMGDEYVSTSVNWGELKKTLSITADGDVINSDGEFIGCLTTHEIPPSVDVKIEE